MVQLLKYFHQRNLSTPRQQKNYVVDVRNEIKSRFGEDYPALQVVGFDAETWTKINQPIHYRVEDRLQNTRFLTNPDAIVEPKHCSPIKLPLGPIWQSASAL